MSPLTSPPHAFASVPVAMLRPSSPLALELGAGFAARVTIFIREVGDTSPFPAELFVRPFGITPAECSVMLMLVQDMTVSVMAETLGIALPTAKTHLSRLFEKTGTGLGRPRLAMSAMAPTGA